MNKTDVEVLETKGDESIDRRQMLIKAVAVFGGAVAAAALPAQAMAANGEPVVHRVPATHRAATQSATVCGTQYGHG